MKRLAPVVEARRRTPGVPAQGGHQVRATAEVAAQQAQEYLLGTRRKGNVRGDGQQQKDKGKHQRSGGDTEKVVALFVGNGGDDDEQDQAECPAQHLLGRCEQIADGEGRRKDQQAKAEEAGQLWHDEDIQDTDKQKAGGRRGVQQ